MFVARPKYKRYWQCRQEGIVNIAPIPLAGIPVEYVGSAYTSQECPSCGYTASHNRISQSEFRCRQCGYANHADIVGALNIQHRAVVNQPNARGSHGQVPVTVDGQAVCFS